MPDQKITVTEEMVAAALNAANEYGRDGGWLTSAGLCRSAITAALDAAPATEGVGTSTAVFMAESARDYWQERAEKAERERDEARESLREANGTVESLRTMTARDHLNAACQAGHPLPKGATIPEGAAFWVRSPGEPWEFVSPGPDGDFDTSPFPNSQYVLLDPPTPKRPEGAEQIHRLMLEFWGSPDDASTGDALADHLASRGVRVVTEEVAS